MPTKYGLINYTFTFESLTKERLLFPFVQYNLEGINNLCLLTLKENRPYEE